jgi:drug/metabolite transporter (DMT)-like permease
MSEYAWLWFSLGAVACWGLWAFLPKIALRKASPAAVFVIEALGAMAVGSVVLALAPKSFHPLGALFAFGAGIAGYAGIYLFIRLADRGSIGTAAAATSIYPVVTVLLGAVFLGERPTLLQAVGVLLAVIAVFLISLPSKRVTSDQ